MHFKTNSCEQTPSVTHKSCEIIDSSTALSCRASLDNPSAFCSWQAPQLEISRSEAIIGYRILLSAPLKAVEKVTINPPQARNVEFKGLERDTEYSVHVQTITSAGLGEVMRSKFRTFATLGNSEELNGIGFGKKSDRQILNDVFSAQEIIELPLETSASSVVRWLSTCCFLLICNFLGSSEI